jgi:energy-coupling factor transporter ATP-binding protein EcfA2
MLKLMRAGYSPALARTILERMPETLGAPEAMHWMMEAILSATSRPTPGTRPAVPEEGGIYALVGATGVGKTTTAAKLAGLCAARTARQRRPDHARHLARRRPRAAARTCPHAGPGGPPGARPRRAAGPAGPVRGKKMVLIDTTGLAPRDPRKRDMLDVLDLPGVAPAGAQRRRPGRHAGRGGGPPSSPVGGAASHPVQDRRSRQARPGTGCGHPPPAGAARRHQRPEGARGLGPMPTPPELVRESMRSNQIGVRSQAGRPGLPFMASPTPGAAGRTHPCLKPSGRWPFHPVQHPFLV